MSTIGKYWVFTYNNPTHYPEEFGALLVNLPNFKYAVFQHEKGDNGTPHYQGYLEFTKNTRRTAIIRLSTQMHMEKRRGSQAEARAYAMKADSRLHGPWEFGEFTPTKQGRRNDLTKLKSDLLAGEPLHKLVVQTENNQQLRFLQNMSAYVTLSHKYQKKNVYWFWGPTGTGKTRTAIAACPEGDTWFAKFSGQWFDGYSGQGYVIIDEFRAKNWPYDLMLRLLDGYELSLPVKGGFTKWCPHTIYITCPLDPEEVYHGQMAHHGSIDQLKRRITAIRHFDEEVDDPIPVQYRNNNNNNLDLSCDEVVNYATLECDPPISASVDHYVPPKNIRNLNIFNKN